MPKKLKHLIWSWGLIFVLAIASFSLVLSRTVHAESYQKLLLADNTTISAKDAFRAAYQIRDFHDKIGSYYLLTAREIRSTQTANSENKLVADTRIQFNSIQ